MALPLACEPLYSCQVCQANFNVVLFTSLTSERNADLGSEEEALKLPFDIRTAERPAISFWSVIFFDFMRWSGAQTVIGNALGFCLDILHSLLLFFLFIFTAPHESKVMSQLKEPKVISAIRPTVD